MSIEEIQKRLDNGGYLIFKGSTDRRIEVIQATPYGVGWFYNGDQSSGAPDLARLVERARVNLDVWELVAWEPSQLPAPYVQLVLF